MCQKSILKSKFSFLLEIGIGLLQSFFSPIGLLWIFIFAQRLDLEKTIQSRLKTAWLSSFFYYISTLYWVSFALEIEIDKFWWLIPVALFILPGYVSIFPAVASLWWKRGFPIAWICLEWLRGWLFTGFPWGFVGHLWLDTPFIQTASWGGVFFLSFISIFTLSWSGLKKWILVPVTMLSYILPQSQNMFFDHKIRIVQPNVTQEDKWDRKSYEQRFLNLLDISKPQDPLVSSIAMPETALTFFLEDFPDRVKKLKEIIPEHGHLFTGGVRRQIDSNNQDYKLRTSLLALNKKGDVVAFYDKHHLIPFGEYLPSILRFLFPKLSKITFGEKDYTPGTGPANISLPNTPSFHPIICYESAFSHEITSEKRADFILLITNDAWFGKSIGAKQHLDLARIRAIEQGMSVIRSANTGISALIDPQGHILNSIPLGQKGAIDVFIPKPNTQTFYAKYMYLENYIMTLLSIMLILALIRGYRK